jgi:hypothetical protein
MSHVIRSRQIAQSKMSTFKSRVPDVDDSEADEDEGDRVLPQPLVDPPLREPHGL